MGFLEADNLSEDDVAYLRQYDIHIQKACGERIAIAAKGENPSFRVLVDTWENAYCKNREELKALQMENAESLSDLVLPYTIIEIKWGTKKEPAHCHKFMPDCKKNFCKKHDRIQSDNPKEYFKVFQRNNLLLDEEDLSRCNMKTYRVCLFNVQNNICNKNPARTVQALMHMFKNCLEFQVDLVAGDANGTAYRLGEGKPINPIQGAYNIAFQKIYGHFNNYARNGRGWSDGEPDPLTGRVGWSIERIDHRHITCNGISDYFSVMTNSDLNTSHENTDVIVGTVLMYGHSIEKKDIAKYRLRL